MLGTFIDTIIVCTVTGMAILSTGVWHSGTSGAALTSLVFDTALPAYGGHIVGIALALFAFTTFLGWSVYGERCAGFLFGARCVTPDRVLWLCAIPVGAMVELDFIWLVADTPLNALMALPNLIALALLSPVVFALTRVHLNGSK